MKINDLLEAKGCPCCGCNTMKECKCGADCADCDCHSMNETTSAGAIASVSAPVGNVQRRVSQNGLDSDNLMGGPKKKKKKSSRSN